MDKGTGMTAKPIRWSMIAGLGSAALLSAQAAAQTAKLAPPVPPPPVIMAPPAPPAPPPPPDFGPAPQAAAAPATPLDPKALKDLRKRRVADAQICLNSAELKKWMAKGKLEACDRVLGLQADPADPGYARAQLLQHRALALLAQGDLRNAQGALDESDALGAARPDPLFDGSVAVGNLVLRAYALHRTGKRDEAFRLLEQVRQRRPWSPSTLALADGIESGLSGDFKRASDRMAARQRIDPDVARALIYLYLMQGDLAKSAALADRVSLVDPRLSGGWSMTDGTSDKERLQDRLRMEAGKAYAIAGQGDAARSAALFQAARQSITDYVGKDPSITADPRIKPRRSDVERHAARKLDAVALTGMLDEWEMLVAQRPLVKDMTVKTLMERLAGYKHKGDVVPAVIEQIRLFGTLHGDKEGKAAGLFADDLMRRMLGEAFDVEPGKLGPRLPRLEALEQVPKFASTASKWLFTDGSGYSQSKEGDGEVRTVRYESLIASRAMVEELCLLAIANYARTEGKDGFVILSNRTLARQTTVSGMWVGTSVSDSGFEAQARVRLVNSAALPADLAGQQDRVILASEIEQQLKPRYDAYLARKDAIAAAARAAKGK